MKYIMLETDEDMKLPILFPDAFVHANVAELMKRLTLFQLKANRCEVVNAGFVSIADASVHGESESLGGMKHNPVDGIRILAGESVSHMPDFVVQKTFAKILSEAAMAKGNEEAPTCPLGIVAAIKASKGSKNDQLHERHTRRGRVVPAQRRWRAHGR